ncbi:uncharacterized protein N7498_004776 [Penicillium cinerascens]|uniref:U4/U6.U5 small nuclear ribonucleoprotein 27kDa protein domain-containing protein n=1 Tax=Penicillium cinerascens TaxID=70096 RepID=A0A9W9SZL3_9EURO|nr:uncharacterized protein N7498_004776 [Penicillium cinerascens]KAJ5203897.1 hypothetical protein N7498_004776 [Penicillium cinerascens]
MAEPPAKRARRVDSSAMWDMNDSNARSAEPESDLDRRRPPPPRDDRRDAPRDDRRYRSRSRDRKDIKQERSWSRDPRDNDRDRRDRDGRGGRDSRGRGHDRRGYPPKGEKLRDRSRSRSPARNGTKISRSRSPPSRGYKGDRRSERRDPRARDDGRGANGASGPGHYKQEMDVDFKEDADEDEMDEMMRRSMGFSRFRTTKNSKVPGNDIYGVRKEKKSEYRQYMNRTGGFNRPLSPSRS